MEYTWHFQPLWQYLDLWASGCAVTLQLSALSIFFGTIGGGILAVGVRTEFRLLVYLCRAYIDVVRSIPALVLMGTLFFSLPAFGWQVSPFQTAFISLTINLSPFAAEILRSGLESVGRIQYESAKLLGLTEYQLIRYIIVPQVVRRITPALVGEYITTVKLTSLAATIGLAEIWNVTGQVIALTSLPLEARLVGAALYVFPLLLLLWASRKLERRFRVLGFGSRLVI
jgi:His/Glu/Gln/Arg/opine family amino acid ABC transporter permease subunit